MGDLTVERVSWKKVLGRVSSGSVTAGCPGVVRTSVDSLGRWVSVRLSLGAFSRGRASGCSGVVGSRCCTAPQFMQKKSPLYMLLKEDTVWSMDHLNRYINDKFRKTKGLPRDWVFTTFTVRVLLPGASLWGGGKGQDPLGHMRGRCWAQGARKSLRACTCMEVCLTCVYVCAVGVEAGHSEGLQFLSVSFSFSFSHCRQFT